MDEIVNTKSKPLYQELYDVLLERIERRFYTAGSKLPTEYELADEFNTTRITVRNALDILEQEGLIRRIQGKGTFVAQSWNEGALDVRGGFRELVRQGRETPSVRILEHALRSAGSFIALMLDIQPEDMVLYVRRLNLVNDEPVSIHSTYIRTDIFPSVEEIDFSVFSMYETYSMYEHSYAYANQKLSVVELSAHDAQLLNAQAGESTLMIEDITYDSQDLPLEFVRSISSPSHAGFLHTY